MTTGKAPNDNAQKTPGKRKHSLGFGLFALMGVIGGPALMFFAFDIGSAAHHKTMTAEQERTFNTAIALFYWGFGVTAFFFLYMLYQLIRAILCGLFGNSTK